MGILNYLPTFKVVEPNRLAGLNAGHVISQFPLFDTSALINTHSSGVRFLENGFIVGLGADLTVDGYDPAKHSEPFLLFVEEINTFMDGLKYYATEEDPDGDIYPRGIGLRVGDAFTTNNYALDNDTNDNQFNAPLDAASANFARVIDGVLILQDIATENTLFVTELSTLPDGTEAVKFTYVGTISAVTEPVA